MTETAGPAAGRALLGAVLRIATPLILGTLGVLLCERAGVLNLGIEGIMVAAPLPAGWRCTRAAAVGRRARWRRSTGALFGLLHGVLTVSLGLSQHVAGLGITLLATSLASYAYRVSFPKVDSPPTIEPFAPMAWLPVPVLNAQTPLTLLALALVPLVGLAAVPHAAGPGAAHGGREPGRGRRPGPERGAAAHRRGDGRLGADGHGRRLPHAGGLQRLLLQHGQRPRLGLRGAGGVRVVAARARRCWARCCSPSSTRCSCACSRPAAACWASSCRTRST